MEATKLKVPNQMKCTSGEQAFFVFKDLLCSHTKLTIPFQENVFHSLQTHLVMCGNEAFLHLFYLEFFCISIIYTLNPRVVRYSLLRCAHRVKMD